MKNSSTIVVSLLFCLSNLATISAQEEMIVNIEESKIFWVGKKITGSHEGYVPLASGTLKMKANKLTGGNFSVALSELYCTDLKGKGKTNLEKHLKSDDFFAVKNYPKANLVFTEVTPLGNNNYKVTGNLTIKGISEPISFEMNLGENTANAKLVVDRTKYGIRYGSNSFFDNLGDKAIYDDFNLDVSLKF